MTTDNDEPIVLDVGSPGWVDDGRLWTAAEVSLLTADQRDALAPAADAAHHRPVDPRPRVRRTHPGNWQASIEEYRQSGRE